MRGGAVEPLRSCGPCHLCCKVFPIPEVGKPHTDWCANLAPDRGCGIYADRPEPCRAFHCFWRLDPSLPENWRPDIAGFLISDPPPWGLLVVNDTDDPRAWRRAPYEKTLRAWMEDASARGIFAGVREAETVLFISRGDEKIILGA